MTYDDELIRTLADTISSHALEEGYSELTIPNTGVYKSTVCHKPIPTIYEPVLCLVAQGAKNCHIGDDTFCYKGGDVFINFLAMPATAEIIEASNDEPHLSVVLSIDLIKLSEIILKIEQLSPDQPGGASSTVSSVMTSPAPNGLVELFIKLLNVAHNPMDAQILGESIVNEIYYRLLTCKYYGSDLRGLLNQYGQIQPISRAVTFIHDNMDKTIQINDLAGMANMSKTTFFNAFKKIMHVAPNQYIKSTKLRKAQQLLSQGIQANEASYNLGYNSFSQFSREYKRLFGFPPSETMANV